MGNRRPPGGADAAHLGATRVLLDRACSGWRGIKVVHVGGTSGKGSTSYMLAAMLSRSHRTGLLTSPHLFDVRERARVDMEPIPRETLVDIVEGTVVPECERLVREDPRSALRFPEVMLAVAYCHFHREGAEWAVLEVAMGGRFDATNVVMPEAAAITNVTRDHARQLGPTLEDIAWHKSGIAKPGVPLYTTETRERVLRVLRREARKAGAPLRVVRPERGEGGELRFRGRDWHLAMAGGHQLGNAALALAIALDVAHLPEDACAEALASTVMPGRFERVRPGVWTDLAHNPAKMRALARTVDAELAGRPVVLVVGMARGKDHASTLRPLLPLGARVVFTRSRHRGADPAMLARRWVALGGDGDACVVEEVPGRALARARALAGRGGAVVVTGSTFVIDEALNPEPWLREANASYSGGGRQHRRRAGA